MTVLAIDPGTHDSAYVVWTDGKGGWANPHIFAAGIEPNQRLLCMLKFNEIAELNDKDVCAIEMIASYGMSVGKEVFETCVWIGRFYEHCRPEPRLVYRRDVKLHHCGSARAKDANINQALRDKYGEKGTKANPGITYGLRSHLWAAFALATFISETATNAGGQCASSKVEDAPRTGAMIGVPPVRAVSPQQAVIAAVTGP